MTVGSMTPSSKDSMKMVGRMNAGAEQTQQLEVGGPELQ